MFSKLRHRIIIITMTITTVVLLIAGGTIMGISSTARPDPRPFPGMPEGFSEVEIRDFVKKDRNDGNSFLLGILLCVGAVIEILVFLITYYASRKMVEPVKDSYEKQKMFIANASHELKTPLAVIQANMEALDVDKENEKWVNNIETEITHANKLVLDLLQLAKMDVGSEDKMLPEKVDLKELLNERVEMFSPKFEGKISLKCEADKTERLIAKQDFLQVLDILMDNATKYGDKKIAVALKPNGIEVMNDGAKISKEDRTKVFDRFYQTDKTREGSGLGLAIAKAISEKNNWNIVCESDEKFTKFVLSF